MKTFDSYTDEDFKSTIWNALVLVVVGVAIGAPLLWWKFGWETAALLAIGAVISGSGLFEWLRLMTALMSRMDSTPESSTPVRPIAPVLIGFFLRLGLAVAVLYVSLKFLDGSVYALIAGLALGVAALSFEALRLIKSWTL